MKLQDLTSSNGAIAKPRKRITFEDSDDDDDFEPLHTSSKKRRTEAVSEDKLDLVIDELGSIKSTLSNMMTLNENSAVPLGLRSIIANTFKCTICHSVPIKPPVITTKCCKTILGCEDCVNTWYSGDEALTKTCPSCRAERDYNETLLLRGLDEFLNQVSKVMASQTHRGSIED